MKGLRILERSKRDKAQNNARTLRKNQTKAEAELWSKLRNRQMNHLKFRRQYLVGPYIVDFICLEKMLAIELDGGQHNKQQRYDQARTNYLEQKGFRVMRFWNNDINDNMNGVLETIEKEVKN